MGAPLQDLVQGADSGERIAEEIARLELLRRLSMGAAHTLNNAFTAILGETLYLLDERKGDPIVTEACALIQGEVERCAKLTRSVALRVQHRDGLLGETNLVSLLRAVEPLLRETLSRSVAIACEAAGDGLCVRGATEDLELLVLLCAHRLVHGIPRGGQLRVAAERGPDGDVALTLELRAGAGAISAAEPSPWDQLVGVAAASLASRHGVRFGDESSRETLATRLYFDSPASTP